MSWGRSLGWAAGVAALLLACDDGGGASADAAARDAHVTDGSGADASVADMRPGNPGDAVVADDAARPFDAATLDGAGPTADGGATDLDGASPDAQSWDVGVEGDSAEPPPDAIADGPEPDAAPPGEPPVLNEVACGARSWVELLNVGDVPTRLDGWSLSGIPATAVPDGQLAPGAFLRVELAAEVPCADGEVRLLDPAGEVVASVRAGDPPAGATWGRLPDAVGAWQVTAPTPGGPNGPLVSYSLVFNEISCRGEEWVELYNTGEAPLELEGFVLTDRPGDPDHRAPLAAGEIAPGGYRVVEMLPFGIGCGDDHLVLLDPDGGFVAEADVGEHPRGASVARLPNAVGPWAPARATPGAANQPLGEISLVINEVDCQGREWVELFNLSADPADLDGWTLTDDPELPGYALRGVVEPGAHFVVHEQDDEHDGFEFGIACGADTLRLIRPDGDLEDEVALPEHPEAFTWGRLPDARGDWQETRPTEGAPNEPAIDDAAVLFDPLHVFQVDVVADDESIQSLRDFPRQYTPAAVTITVDGEEHGPFQVGFRIKGRIGSFRQLDSKPSFKIKFHEYEADQRFLGLERLTLNNQVQDRATLHEWTCYRIFRAMGVAAPRVGYAYVTLNGQEYGLYSNIETPDDVFLARHYASTHAMYEGAYGQDLFAGQVFNLQLEDGPEDDRPLLQRLVQLLDVVPEGGFYDATQEIIDWPRLLAAMATEVWTGHWDGYAPTRNNYYFHFDRQERLTLLPWGTDQTFGRHLDLHGGRGRLMETCVREPDCRIAYDRTLGRVNDLVAELDLEPQIRAIAAAIRPWSEMDPRRAYNLPSIDSNVEATIAFINRQLVDTAASLECLLSDSPDPDGDGSFCDADCAPDDPTIHPGAMEICGDGIDQDCNGLADDALHCPDCIERFRGGKRYLVCPNARNFAEARTHCQDEGAEPVVVDDEGEAVWIATTANEIRRQDYWIGLTDAGEEGVFRYWDGSEPVYTRWAPNEPNNSGGNEDCAHIRGGRDDWNDRNCGTRIGVLCENTCLPGVDADRDGFDDCNADCNPRSAAIHPGADELCNDVDDDCDGEVDELPRCICTARARLGRLYYVCDAPRTWAEARAHCQSLGQDLAVVNDAPEDQWLHQRASEVLPQEYWLGMSDQAEEGVFRWVDGSAPGYTNWNPGSPFDSGDEDCVHFWGDSGLWNDYPCDRRLGFLCEQVD